MIEASTLLVLEASPGCEQVLGVPLARVIGRPFTHWFDSAVRTDLANAFSVLARATVARQFYFVLDELELIAQPGSPGQLQLTLRGRQASGKSSEVRVPA